MTNSHQVLVIGLGDNGLRQGVKVLRTSPGERLTGVAIVVYVYIKIFVLVFIGTITETCIYWNIKRISDISVLIDRVLAIIRNL